MNAIARLCFVLFALATAGCVGPVSYTATPPAPKGAPVRDWQSIEVVDRGQIKRDYEIVGECRGDGWLDNTLTLKKMAARLNADAITLPEDAGGGYIIALALRYKDKPATGETRSE
jgi:hypothetical protein